MHVLPNVSPPVQNSKNITEISLGGVLVRFTESANGLRVLAIEGGAARWRNEKGSPAIPRTFLRGGACGSHELPVRMSRVGPLEL